MGMEAGECLGSLGVVRQILASYPRVRNLLENERIGNGVFQMDLDDPEHAQGMSAALWDLSLLASHYHPTCAAAAREVANLPLNGAIAPPPGSHARASSPRRTPRCEATSTRPWSSRRRRAKPRAPRERKSFVDVFSDDFAASVATTDSHGTDTDATVPDADFRRHFKRQRAHVARASLLRERDGLARLSRRAPRRRDHRASLLRHDKETSLKK